MAYYGVQFRLRYKAWNTADNAPVTGDVANHTITLRRDGTDAAFVGTKTEIGGGDYEAVISATLAQAYEIAGRGVSSTADVELFFEPPIRTVRLPNVEPGVNGGLPVLESHGVMDPQGNLEFVAMPTGLFESLNRLNAVVSTTTLMQPIRLPGQSNGLPILDADGNWLTAGQQGQLDAIEDDTALIPAIKVKTDLLNSSDSVQFPGIAAGGSHVVYEGFDYLDTGNASVSVSESTDGEWDSERLALDSFRFYMRSRTTDDDVDVPAELSGSGLQTLSADITSDELPTQVGTYDGFFYAVDTDTGTGSIEDDRRYPIVKVTVNLQRGRKICT